MKESIAIIILTWNGLEYTKKCLDSLKPTLKQDSYRVYVVDNNSLDGTVEYLSGLPFVTFIRNSENIGFVRGNNCALNQIPDGDVILLNNDMIITDENWIEKLHGCAYAKEDTGVVGCRLENEKGEFLHAGTMIYPDSLWGRQIGRGQKNIGQYPFDREVQGIVFACAYLKRAVIEAIGGLNEDFFSYFEDTDYCLRAKEAGFKTVYCADVTLIHYQNVSTTVNEVNFSDMFRTSQKTFKGLWQKKLEDRYERKLAWRSIVNFPSGYAVSSKNFMMALDDRNVDVRYAYAYGKGTPFPVEEKRVCDNFRIQAMADRSFEKKCPQVVYAQGDVFFRNNGSYKIGFTMLETTGIPKEWVKQCNRMDEVWVPSSFNVETFRNSGVKVPIYIIPLGIDENYYNPSIQSVKQHDRFTFLSVFEWGERKAPELLLDAYVKAFRGCKDVVLLCKVNNSDAGLKIEDEIKKKCGKEEDPEVVVLYNTKFPDYQMPMLYRAADCFVLPTRGEGWGMPILEAMACGLPAIATNWSSQTDFMTEENSYPVRVAGLIDAKAKCPYYEGFQWANPDEEHLIERMRYVYEHREEAAALGLRASSEILSKWTWGQVTGKMTDRLKQIENR